MIYVNVFRDLMSGLWIAEWLSTGSHRMAYIMYFIIEWLDYELLNDYHIITYNY